MWLPRPLLSRLPRPRALVALAAVPVVGLAGCTGSPSTPPQSSTPPPSSSAPTSSGPVTPSTAPTTSPSGPTYLVGLGDSVATGNACRCVDFVHLFGQLVARHTGRPNHTDNISQDGRTTTGVIAQLATPSTRTALARADLVVIMIGANDLEPARAAQRGGECGGADGADCTREALADLRTNLTTVLRRVRELTDTHPVGIRVADYWNAFTAGSVAVAKYGAEDLRESEAFTRSANAVTCQVARAAGAVCVDTYQPFITATADGDPTSLLAPDGDHPNQAGQWVIARAIAAAGFAPL